MFSWRVAFFCAASWALVACGDDPSGDAGADGSVPPDGGRLDGTVDAGTDADGGMERDAGFVVPSSVVINELMYHPADNAGAAEFVELFNEGTEAVNLRGWRIRGVSFAFPETTIQAGAYLVVAENAADFEAAHGFAPAHVFTGKLSNDGELVELVDESGVVRDRVTYSDMPPWPVRADGFGPSLELVTPALLREDVRAWRAGGPSPGRVNTVAQAELPPWVESVTFPADPEAGAAIRVSATIQGATGAELSVKIGFDDPTVLPMTNAAGTFSADIPGQPEGTLVRFRVTAQGPTGEGTWPRAGDSVTWDGTVVRDPSVVTSLPVFQWFMSPQDYQTAIDERNEDNLHPAVFYYGGVMFDSAVARIKGDSSRQNLKPSWKIKLPKGHLFFISGRTPAPVDQFNLQSSYADKSYVRELLAYRTWAEAGMPSTAAFSVRLHQNGGFYGLYTFVEDMDRDYLKRNNLDDEGAWYECGGDGSPLGLGDIEFYYEKNTRTNESHADLVAFLQAMNNSNVAARHAYALDNLNLPAMINYLAVNIVIHNNDHMSKNYYLYRDTRNTGRWTIMQWDMDLTFGRNSDPQVLSDNIMADDDWPLFERPWVSPSHPLFGDRDHQKWDELWNRIIDAVLADPELRTMYYRRLRSVMDQFLAPGLYEGWIQTYSSAVASEAALDVSQWGMYGMWMPHADSVAQITGDYLPRRRQHLFTTHRVNGEIPAIQSPTANVVINELLYAPAGGDAQEFVELFNPSTDAVDVSGWRMDALGLTIPSGTVLLPGAYAVLVRDDAAFRGTRGGGRFIPGSYAGALDDGGETVELVDRTERTVDRVSFGVAAPWPVTAGASLELISATSDHSLPTSWAASTAPGGTPGARNSTAN